MGGCDNWSVSLSSRNEGTWWSADGGVVAVIVRAAAARWGLARKTLAGGVLGVPVGTGDRTVGFRLAGPRSSAVQDCTSLCGRGGSRTPDICLVSGTLDCSPGHMRLRRFVAARIEVHVTGSPLAGRWQSRDGARVPGARAGGTPSGSVVSGGCR